MQSTTKRIRALKAKLFAGKILIYLGLISPISGVFLACGTGSPSEIKSNQSQSPYQMSLPAQNYALVLKNLTLGNNIYPHNLYGASTNINVSEPDAILDIEALNNEIIGAKSFLAVAFMRYQNGDLETIPVNIQKNSASQSLRFSFKQDGRNDLQINIPFIKTSKAKRSEETNEIEPDPLVYSLKGYNNIFTLRIIESQNNSMNPVLGIFLKSSENPLPIIPTTPLCLQKSDTGCTDISINIACEPHDMNDPKSNCSRSADPESGFEEAILIPKNAALNRVADDSTTYLMSFDPPENIDRETFCKENVYFLATKSIDNSLNPKCIIEEIEPPKSIINEQAAMNKAACAIRVNVTHMKLFSEIGCDIKVFTIDKGLLGTFHVEKKTKRL